MKIQVNENELKRVAQKAIFEVIKEDFIQPSLIEKLKTLSEEKLAYLWNAYGARKEDEEIWEMGDLYNVIADTPNGDEMISDDFDYNDKFFYGEFINNGKEGRYHSAKTIYEIPFFNIEKLAIGIDLHNQDRI